MCEGVNVLPFMAPTQLLVTLKHGGLKRHDDCRLLKLSIITSINLKRVFHEILYFKK